MQSLTLMAEQDALDVMTKGRTTVIIAHRLSTVINGASLESFG